MNEQPTVDEVPQEPQVKRCTHCHQKRPINEFRRRSKNSDERQCQCRECRNRDERELRAAKTQKTFVKYARKVNRADCDPFVVTAVTCELMQRLGGLEKFCTKFVQAIEDAESARNHAAVSSYLGAVIQLSTVSSQMIEKSTDYSLVSTEDLKRQADRQLVELVRANPQLALWAASQLPEWRVEPAGEIVTPMI